jgi:hypothetical protein
MSAALQSRLDEVIARADDILARRLRRDEEQLEREAAEQRRADAEQARADAWRNREIGELYDEAFRSFGTETPQPRDDERPSRYRRRLFSRLQRKLPDAHDLAGVRADELPSGAAFVNSSGCSSLPPRLKAKGRRSTTSPTTGRWSRVIASTATRARSSPSILASTPSSSR